MSGSNEQNKTGRSEEKPRPDTTPVPPTRMARLKDAVRHLKDGGTMATADINDLYNLLDEIETEQESKGEQPMLDEEKAS